MPKAVLSHKQFAIILLVYQLGASVLFIPEALFAGKDAWISTILGTIISVVLLAAWLHLQRKFPGMSLIQYGIKIMGPWIGYPAGFILVYLLFVIATLIVEDMAILASIIMLPNTPPGVVRLSFILVAVYACYKGIESIARICELVFALLILIILLLPIMEYGQLGVGVFQPVDVIDWYGVAVGTVNALTFPFAEVLVPAILLPFVSIDRESEKYYYIMVLIAGGLLFIRTIMGLMIFGPELLSRFTLPMIAIFRAINLGVFLNRVEGIFLGIWYLGLLLKLAITLYAGVLGFSQIFGIKRLENLWLPVAVLLFFVSETRYPNPIEFGYFSFYVLPFLAIPGEVLWPFALVIVNWLRGRLKPAAINKFD